MKFLRTLSMGSVLAIPFAASATALGSYNALVFGDFNSNYTDTEGSLAVGGNFLSSGYTVGVKLPSAPLGGADAMVVGGNVNWVGSGSVNNGNLRYGGTGSFLNAYNPTVNGGTHIHDSSVTSIFNPLKTHYTALSSYLGGLAQTGTSVINHYSKWQFNLTGANSTLNVFNVSAAKLSDCDTFTVNAPASSTVLINIVDDNGHALSLSNFGIALNGVSKSHVVFNAPTLTSIAASGVGINGSLLAPGAAFNTQYGNLDGQLIAKSFSGGYQINSYNFTGNLPSATPVPEPGTWAALGLGALAMLRRRKK